MEEYVKISRYEYDVIRSGYLRANRTEETIEKELLKSMVTLESYNQLMSNFESSAKRYSLHKNKDLDQIRNGQTLIDNLNAIINKLKRRNIFQRIFNASI